MYVQHLKYIIILRTLYHTSPRMKYLNMYREHLESNYHSLKPIHHCRPANKDDPGTPIYNASDFFPPSSSLTPPSEKPPPPPPPPGESAAPAAPNQPQSPSSSSSLSEQGQTRPRLDDDVDEEIDKQEREIIASLMEEENHPKRYIERKGGFEHFLSSIDVDSILQCLIDLTRQTVLFSQPSVEY